MISTPKGTRLHVVGDSITLAGWHSATGSLVDQVNATWSQPADKKIAGTNSGRNGVLQSGARSATVKAVTPTRPQITVTADGVGGSRIVDLIGNETARIINYNPQILIIEYGFNDANQTTNLTTFVNDYNSILDTVHAALPSCKVLCLSIFMWFEEWQVSPPQFLDNNQGNNATLVGYNNQIQTAVAAHSSFAEYCDLRADALAYEMAHNTPAPGVAQGILTSDGIHPIVTSGQVVMGTTAAGHLAGVP